MGQPKKPRADVRTTVSLAQVVWDMAEDMMEVKGYNNNFSAYVAELIRRDKERQEEKEAALGKSSSSNLRREEHSSGGKSQGTGAGGGAKQTKAA